MPRAGTLRVEVSRSQLAAAAECLRSSMLIRHGHLHSKSGIGAADLLAAEAERLNAFGRDEYLALLDDLSSRLSKAARRSTEGMPVLFMSTGQMRNYLIPFPWECERQRILTLATLGVNAKGWRPMGMFGRPELRGQQAEHFFSKCLFALLRRPGRKYLLRGPGAWKAAQIGERQRKRLKAKERARANTVSALLARLKLPD